MVARSPTEGYLALNLEGNANAFLIKFKDLSVSDKIEWCNSVGIDAGWNYKYITAISYHETKSD